jgi:hypothetical protein
VNPSEASHTRTTWAAWIAVSRGRCEGVGLCMSRKKPWRCRACESAKLTISMLSLSGDSSKALRHACECNGYGTVQQPATHLGVHRNALHIPQRLKPGLIRPA